MYINPFGSLCVIPKMKENIFVYGNFPIATHQTLEVEVVLTFFLSIGRAPEPIISDVIFTDNFENQTSRY